MTGLDKLTLGGGGGGGCVGVKPAGSADVAVARHSPASSIAVLWCSGMGVSQPSQ